MATIIRVDEEDLPLTAVLQGTNWANGLADDHLVELIESDASLYVVRTYYFNDDRYEQWSDDYYTA